MRREEKKLIRSSAGLALIIILSACGAAAKKPVEIATETKPGMAKTKPVVPATGPGGGGYYLDDGPGDNPPDLDSIRDAVPRPEPLHRFANRPYTVMGRTYTPQIKPQDYRAQGVASWYGRRYHGQKTSSGEIYDMYAMSAAHPTLPIPSYARVTNPANGKTIVVRVNDRGPFRHDRLIDLSYTAAYRLDLLRGGSGSVIVENINPANSTVKAVVITESAKPAPEPLPVPVSKDSRGFYLQLGAFGQQENAETFRSKLSLMLGNQTGQLNIQSRDGLHRVQLGPYPTQSDATQADARIRETLGIKPVITQR